MKPEWIIDMSEAIGLDLRGLFERFESFYTNDFGFIQQYFSGEVQTANPNSFNNLDNLKKEFNLIFRNIEQNQSALNNYKYWEVLELLESMKNDIDTTSNLAKWLRSTVTEVRYSPISTDLTLRQNQTLEMLLRESGDNNWKDNWRDLALNNNLTEEDYTSDGGNLLSVQLVSGRTLQIQSVVDTISKDTILGKDFNRKLTFVDDDLDTLDMRNTFIQSAEICVSLRKGGNPSLPELGLAKEIFGTNRIALNYPFIFRRISECLATDDTFKNSTVEDIRREQDGLFIDIQIESIISDFDTKESIKI